MAIVCPEANAKVAECFDVIEARFGETYIRPVIKFDLNGRVAGQAQKHGNNYVLRLNVDLLDSDENGDEMINQVIPHEVAHIVQFQRYPNSQAHGREWAFLMRVLGVPALRTHSMPVKVARVHKRPYIYACNCQEFQITPLLHRRMQAGQRRYCRRCGGYLHFLRENATA